MEIRDWLDYLARKSDRTLSRTQSSGYTTWALLGLMAAIAYHVLDSSSILLDNLQSYIILLAVMGDAVLIVYILYPSGGTAGYGKSRSLSALTQRILSLAVLPTLVVLQVLALVNFLSFRYSRPIGFAGWLFLVVGCYLVIQLLALPLVLRKGLTLGLNRQPMTDTQFDSVFIIVSVVLAGLLSWGTVKMLSALMAAHVLTPSIAIAKSALESTAFALGACVRN